MTIELFDAAPADRSRYNKHATGEADPIDLMWEAGLVAAEDNDRRHEPDEE
jgi:hypothetical protein